MSRYKAQVPRDFQTFEVLQMPPGKCLELTVGIAGISLLTCQDTCSWQLSLYHLRASSSLFFLIPSVVIQNSLHFL